MTSVALIIYNKKFLLFLRDDIPSIPEPNTWSLVGGAVEEGENYEQAMKREMDEEISIIAKDIKYLGEIKTPDGKMHGIFLARLTEQEASNIKLGNEGQKVEFFGVQEIKNLNLSTNVRKYFELYGNYLEEIVNSNIKIDPKRLGLTD